jgi:hypothetical protein
MSKLADMVIYVGVAAICTPIILLGVLSEDE